MQNPDFLAHLATLAQTIPGGTIIFTTLMFVIVLGLLVFVHELGHYLAARSVGITVQKFSIGFGHEILGWTDKHNTRWKIGWLPLGGYVQMLGQEDLKPSAKSLKPGHFMSKSVWQRAWVIVAGPLANLLFGFVLLLLVMFTGEHRLKAEVGQVLPDMPAVGVLQEGDLITTAGGTPVTDWDTLLDYISAHPSQPVQLTFTRAGQPMQATLTPQTKTFTDLLGDTHTVGRIGVAPSYNTFVVYHGPASAVQRAAEKTWELTSLTVKSLYKLMIGAVSADNLTGPLGIANLTGQTASSGLFSLLMFMTVITINLCIVNLFPLPILDGGHLVFLAYEKLRGKPVGPNAQEWLFRFGLLCIVMLAVFSTVNDVKRLGLIQRLTGTAPAAEATPTP